jgi:hypothetical protein
MSYLDVFRKLLQSEENGVGITLTAEEVVQLTSLKEIRTLGNGTMDWIEPMLDKHPDIRLGEVIRKPLIEAR